MATIVNGTHVELKINLHNQQITDFLLRQENVSLKETNEDHVVLLVPIFIAKALMNATKETL
jgi:hypothetical protein